MNTWTTYKRADGELIAGEYAWVDAPEYFDGDDEPTKLIREEWVLVDTRTVWLPEPKCWVCGDTVTVPADWDGVSPTCPKPDCQDEARA